MKRMRKVSFEQMAEDVWKGVSLGSEGNPQEPVKNHRSLLQGTCDQDQYGYRNPINMYLRQCVRERKWPMFV